MTKLPATVAAALLAASALSIAAAHAGEARGFDNVGGSAFGVAAGFLSGGLATALPPRPLAFGAGGGWDHRGSMLGTLDETLGIAAPGKQIATLQVSASDLAVHGASGKWRHDGAEPGTGGSIGSLQVTLQQYPPPSGPLPAPLLSITGSDIAWQASDSRSWPKPAAVAGSASFGSLKITGSLLSNSTINVSGDGHANDALTFPVGGGYVRVTVDQQVVGGVSSCASTCSFTPFGITVDAVAIHLDRVSIGGQQVTGDILVGDAEAHIRP